MNRCINFMYRNKIRTLLFYGLSLLSCGVYADGELDPTFGGDGIVTVPIGTFSTARAVIALPNSKIMATGISDGNVATIRLLTNGTLDTTFNGTGIVTTDLGSATDTGLSIAIQSDDKIVVGGSTGTGVTALWVVIRYNTDGSLDTTFGTGGIVITPVTGVSVNIAGNVVIQPDGKIGVGGFSAITDDLYVVRYNTDGSLDTTFGVGGIATTLIANIQNQRGLVLQLDGSFVISAEANAPDQLVMARYTNAGVLDGTFGSGGIVTAVLTEALIGGVAIQLSPSQKIVLGGSSGADPNNPDYTVIRYLPNGTLDTTFGSGGFVFTTMPPPGRMTDITVQSDNRIIAAGGAGVPAIAFGFARYLALGPCLPLVGSDTVLEVFNTKQFVAAAGRIANLAMLQDGFALCSDATFDSLFPVVGDICLECHTLTLNQDLIMHNISSIGSVGSIMGEGHVLDLAKSVVLIPSLACTFTFNPSACPT